MRYCMECDRLTMETDSLTCPACGTVLLSLDELPEEDLDRLVVLTWCDSLPEAMVLRAALDDQGIDSILEDEGLLEIANPFHGSGDAQGGTRVLVRLEDAEAALELLRQKDAGELAISEDDVLEEDEEPEQTAPPPDDTG
ncbi:MAG TPA: DUF2007 domain-containing protein [Planctomycetota bacterium]|nr:DUF2007 domain-containing protein [Planctomycetota bacterium]